MITRLRNLLLMLLGQVPTVLTLALLGGIAWWGYVWDWRVPTLPELLDPSSVKKPGETEKKAESEEAKNADKQTREVLVRVLVSHAENKGEQSSVATLPVLKLPSEEVMDAAGIKTQPVEERLIDDRVTAHGHVDFDQNHYAHLATRASGTAWRVFKQAGDEVKKGDVLALIACPELATLKFDLQQMLLTEKARQRSYQRQIKAAESTAFKDRESADFALRDSRLALSKDQQALQNLGLNVSVAELTQLSDEEQVAARLRTLGISDSLLQSLDANAVRGNNLLPMYAPFDGMVVKRDIVVGEMVSPATPQFVLAALQNLWICLHVRLENVSRLKEGQEVAFHLDGPNEDAPPAIIKWISAEVDEKTRTVAVRADVPNPHGRLRPNTFGDARILIDRRKRAIVPNEALQFDGTSPIVFVRGASPTEFQPCRVTLGPRHQDFTVVLSGVQAGQTIATSGSHVLLSAMLKERIAGED
ncbi:MAG: efflux RND transporter periplasmic adaptor subunit [Gemmataceae bacterium]